VDEAPRSAESGEATARRRDPWLRFVLVFAVLAVASELVYYGVALESDLFAAYLALLARISGFLLGLITDDVTVRGTLISSAHFSVEIARGCDAYRICSLLSAAIIAFPSGLRVKLWGLAFGLLWLNVLNFVRILGLFFVGGHLPAHFQASHQTYFPIFLICMTMAAWILWLRWAIREATPPRADPA
jgi:exosortase/archaeosortase family protein